MTETPLHFQPVTTLAARLRAREITAVELVRHFLDRTRRLDDSLHTIVTLAEDQALEAAAQADDQLQRGDAPLLAGIPISVKDAIPTRGIRTTANSRLYMDWIPQSEPASITRLRDAGAIILAKANCNEFFGIPSDADRFPRPRNPFNPAFVSIGSSSGSGASAAAGFCAASIGSDSAGSVRLPAGQHGLFGMKATKGLITRAGSSDIASFQVYGPLTRTTADTALFTTIMAGYDPADPESSARPIPDYVASLGADIRGWRIGVPWRYIRTAPVDPEILSSFEAALETLAQCGGEIVDVPVRGLAEGRMATFVAMYTEHHAAQAVNSRTKLDRLGPSARLYAMQGAFISALDYLNAKKLGYRLRSVLEDIFHDIQIVATPTSPFITAEAARKPSEHRAGINTAFTCPFNLTGHPAITAPCGIASNGIPIGIQFVGKLFDETAVFQIAHAFEQTTDWHKYHPKL
jgi:aspartyl-tRNA(Asn)/glutamyl-tRNA(Gln) amidotransferase subunit A